MTWKVEPETDLTGKLPGKVKKLVLSYDRIPGYEKLKIVKRFTLAPREYHIGLEIEIIDERDAKAAMRPFRTLTSVTSAPQGSTQVPPRINRSK